MNEVIKQQSDDLQCDLKPRRRFTDKEITEVGQLWPLLNNYKFLDGGDERTQGVNDLIFLHNRL